MGLRALEQRGVVTRTIYSEIPPRVEYALTERGRSAWPIVEALREWGETLDAQFAVSPSAAPRTAPSSRR